jgi:hypothetical protein
VRHVQHEQRLHAVIRKAFPGFGERDIAESARMTDEAAILWVVHGRRVLRPALFLASAGSSEVLRSFLRAVVADRVTD